MPYYLLQAVYTPEAWAAMVGEPQDRMEAIRPVLERMGGKLEQGWLAFGDHDVVVLCQMPDNVTAAAFSMAATAGGALKAVKTTPLLTMEESVGAMQKAGEAGYRPPGG